MPLNPPPIAQEVNDGGLAIIPWLQWFQQVFAACATDWRDWTPTVTASGAMTVSGVTILDAQYTRSGPRVDFKLYIACTLGGVAGNQILIGSPLSPIGQNQALICHVLPAGSYWQPTFGYFDSAVTDKFIAVAPGNANYPLGATSVLMSGSYRCA
jgi:hypothetical protein